MKQTLRKCALTPLRTSQCTVCAVHEHSLGRRVPAKALGTLWCWTAHRSRLPLLSVSPVHCAVWASESYGSEPNRESLWEQGPSARPWHALLPLSMWVPTPVDPCFTNRSLHSSCCFRCVVRPYRCWSVDVMWPYCRTESGSFGHHSSVWVRLRGQLHVWGMGQGS